MKQALATLFTCMLLTLTGCTNKAFENQTEIDTSQFPVSIDLNGKDVQLPTISSFGITEIKVLDSVMIMSVMDRANFWHFYSLPEMDSIGSFFNVGNGPNEFPASIPCFQASFYKNGSNDIMTFIPLPDSKKFREVNLSDLLSERIYEPKAMPIDIKSGQLYLWAYGLDQSRYLLAVVNPENNSIERTIKTFSSQSNVNINNEYIDRLNSRHVENMNDLQLLITTPAIGRNGNKVAEIPGYSNQIIIYETTGTGGSCLTYKNMPTAEREIALLAQKGVSLFGGGYGYDDYFTLMRNEIKDHEVVNQHFDFISWEGEPLGSINTGMNTVRRFDMDLTNGTLYCLDSASDTIKAYEIKHFLKEIERFK